MDSREVTTPQFLLWVRKTNKLIRAGYSPGLAGDISARQIFRSYSSEAQLTEIEVEEILEIAQEQFAEQLHAIRDDGAESVEKKRPVLVGSRNRAWPGLIQQEGDVVIIDSQVPVREGQRLAVAYELDDRSRITTKEVIVEKLIDGDAPLPAGGRFGVQLRETFDSPSSSQGD